MSLTPPAADIFEFLGYEPNTGLFTWIKYPGGKAKVGAMAGYFDQDGYRRIRFQGVRYLAAKLAWLRTTGVWPEALVDHANLNKSDDRAINLRLADRSLNTANTRKRKGCSSRFKGVTKVKTGRWQAQIGVRGKHFYLGKYGTEEEAAAAYIKAAALAFGDFARAA